MSRLSPSPITPLHQALRLLASFVVFSILTLMVALSSGCAPASMPAVAAVSRASAPAMPPTRLGELVRARAAASRRGVSAHATERSSAVVAVVGAVGRPGLYPLTRPGQTMAEMIQAAGGPSERAGRVVEFVPALSAERQGEPIRIDIAMLLEPSGSPHGGIEVRGGDVIRVSSAGQVLVDGWVVTPGGYPITPGMTVTGAVAAAGGAVFSGDRNTVTIQRGDAAHRDRRIVVDLDAVTAGEARDVRLAEGDVLWMPIDSGRVAPWGLWAFTREVLRAGGSLARF